MKVLSAILFIFVFVNSSMELRSYIGCPTPKILNGYSRPVKRPRFGRLYMCNQGFLLSGDRYNRCVNGKWDSLPPLCTRPGCRKVNLPKDGYIYRTHMNAVLHFFCKPGFELRGPQETHCNSTAWSYNAPICLPSNTKPELSCDFEKADLCGWTHDLNHDFDWRRMQFNTPTGAIGTGPSFDHTYGEDKGGYYMYIESSSRNENDTARLISPVYDKTENNTCFQFFYHMYGTTIGSLRAYLKMVNESSNLDASKAFFEERGNKGNRWLEYVHMFGPIPKDYQIIIEGTRGSGYVSDIAIDDVKIIENCSLEDLQKLEVTSTTEVEEYSSTDGFLPDDLYSCENRCFSLNITMGKHRKCACDENCYDRNECCPDFIDICILHGPSMDSDYSSSSTLTSTTSTTTKQTPNIFTTKTTTTEKPKRKTTAQITTVVTEKDVTPTDIPIYLHPKTRTTTEKTTTHRSVTETRTTESKTTRTSTLIFTRPTTTRTTTTTTENNKIVENTVKVNKKQYLATTVDLSNDRVEIPDDMVPIEDVAHLKRKYNEKIIIVRTEEHNNLPLYLGCGGVILVISVLVIVVIRRRISTRSRGFRSASRGDSASDVRFLTSDEFLDLNLEYN